jgi:hypothetical protein
MALKSQLCCSRIQKHGSFNVGNRAIEETFVTEMDAQTVSYDATEHYNLHVITAILKMRQEANSNASLPGSRRMGVA